MASAGGGDEVGESGGPHPSATNSSEVLLVVVKAPRNLSHFLFLIYFFFEFLPGDYFHLNIFKKSPKGRFIEVLRRKNNTERPSAGVKSGIATKPHINIETIAGRGDY